jgi:predicted acylesterase/phospholipase RssA
VLTGGGSLGSIHVGMLEALYERGIAPDLIVGTSVGAVNGAYIASRPQSVETARMLGDGRTDTLDLVGSQLAIRPCQIYEGEKRPDPLVSDRLDEIGGRLRGHAPS